MHKCNLFFVRFKGIAKIAFLQNIKTKNIILERRWDFYMNELVVKDDIKIEDMIYEIRGVQVMLDSDLAKLYGVETKRINEAVNRNLKKFPEKYSWRLTDIESKVFLVANCDQKNERRGGRYKNPRVFTETAVYMLATILKSDIAIEITIKIMDAFVMMKHYVGDNEYRLSNVETKIIDHDDRIKLLETSFEKLGEKKNTSDIYFNGQIFDAYSNIYKISIVKCIIIYNI